jgi:hypothetical protein
VLYARWEIRDFNRTWEPESIWAQGRRYRPTAVETRAPVFYLGIIIKIIIVCGGGDTSLGGLRIPTLYEQGCFPEHKLILTFSCFRVPEIRSVRWTPYGGVNPDNGSQHNNELSTLSMTSLGRVWPLLSTSLYFSLQTAAFGSLMIISEDDRGKCVCHYGTSWVTGGARNVCRSQWPNTPPPARHQKASTRHSADEYHISGLQNIAQPCWYETTTMKDQ